MTVLVVKGVVVEQISEYQTKEIKTNVEAEKDLTSRLCCCRCFVHFSIFRTWINRRHGAVNDQEGNKVKASFGVGRSWATKKKKC